MAIPKITPEQVREAVRKMREMSAKHGQDEQLHNLEDELFLRVLEVIALGDPHAQELAREAVKCAGLTFRRWCA